jgi:hypothetical protein
MRRRHIDAQRMGAIFNLEAADRDAGPRKWHDRQEYDRSQGGSNASRRSPARETVYRHDLPQVLDSSVDSN